MMDFVFMAWAFPPSPSLGLDTGLTLTNALLVNTEQVRLGKCVHVEVSLESFPEKVATLM